MTDQLKTAILFTGAAARISQEVAIFDKLRSMKGLKVSIHDTYIAGFSSGSLNLAAVNSCFSSDDNEANEKKWNDYYKNDILFKLRNRNVYRLNRVDGKIKLGIPILNTDPLRETVTSFVSDMGCKYLGDLPFVSNVLSLSLEKIKTMWASNLVEDHCSLDLVDLFMASTAIPVVFPSQTIGNKPDTNREFPDGKFVDGGTAGTFKLFQDNLGTFAETNGQFDNLFIISPIREKSAADEFEPRLLVKLGGRIFDVDFSKVYEALKNISLNSFLKFLRELNEYKMSDGKPLAKNIFVCIPNMDKKFFILNFNNQKKQHETVCDWVDAHPDRLAIPLQQYLDEHPDTDIEQISDSDSDMIIA